MVTFSKTFTCHEDIKQFSYFTEDFKNEEFKIEKLIIDANAIGALVRVTSSDRLNVPMLLLDRLTQSLGFVVLQEICSQRKKPARLIFIRSMEWTFSGPIRPSHILSITAMHRSHQESDKKELFEIRGGINNRALFRILIDVIGYSK